MGSDCAYGIVMMTPFWDFYAREENAMELSTPSPQIKNAKLQPCISLSALMFWLIYNLNITQEFYRTYLIKAWASQASAIKWLYFHSLTHQFLNRVFFNVKFHTRCAVLKKLCSSNKNMCNSQVYFLVTYGGKKVNSSKNVRFMYELIEETQSEIELLEVVTATPSLQKQAV